MTAGFFNGMPWLMRKSCQNPKGAVFSIFKPKTLEKHWLVFMIKPKLDELKNQPKAKVALSHFCV